MTFGIQQHERLRGLLLAREEYGCDVAPRGRERRWKQTWRQTWASYRTIYSLSAHRSEVQCRKGPSLRAGNPTIPLETDKQRRRVQVERFQSDGHAVVERQVAKVRVSLGVSSLSLIVCLPGPHRPSAKGRSSGVVLSVVNLERHSLLYYAELCSLKVLNQSLVIAKSPSPYSSDQLAFNLLPARNCSDTGEVRRPFSTC